MEARAVGPWVGEQKPRGKTPQRGNPSPESTYLPTFRTDSEKYTSRNQKQNVHTISTDVCQDLANSECTSSTWQQWAHLNKGAQTQSRIWVSRRSSTQKNGIRSAQIKHRGLSGPW